MYSVVPNQYKTYRVYPSVEPNTMGYHRNMLLSSDESNIKAYKPEHTKKIRLVTPEKIRLVNSEE